MKTIDLGRTMSKGELMPAPTSPSEPYYPTLYIDSDGDKLADLPECGTMTIYFERQSVTKTDRDGKQSVSVSLEVQQILNVKADEDDDKKDSRKSRENTLDKYAADAAKED